MIPERVLVRVGVNGHFFLGKITPFPSGNAHTAFVKQKSAKYRAAKQNCIQMHKAKTPF
ncbi:MAG: hypothetical protein ACU836_08715 [Gammaproteobacteria bacterium]